MSTKLERAPVESPAERAEHMSKLTWLQRWTRVMGYAACAWALLFTLEHVYWVSGGSWLLSEALARGFVSLFAQNPWSYVAGMGIIIALFAILALFPLALTWQGKQSTQRHLQWMVVILGYMGLILFAVWSFATQQTVQTVYGLASLGICVLGVGVALVRPHSQSVEHWLVLVATWIFGAGMTIYLRLFLYRHCFAQYALRVLPAKSGCWRIELDHRGHPVCDSSLFGNV